MREKRKNVRKTGKDEAYLPGKMCAGCHTRSRYESILGEGSVEGGEGMETIGKMKS